MTYKLWLSNWSLHDGSDQRDSKGILELGLHVEVRCWTAPAGAASTGGSSKLPSQLQIMHPYLSSLAQLERTPIRANTIALGLCGSDSQSISFYFSTCVCLTPWAQEPNSWTYNFVEVSGHNLEISETWGFRKHCLHYKPVSNHFCWGGGGGVVKSVIRA